jgi:hypothetical protein
MISVSSFNNIKESYHPDDKSFDFMKFQKENSQFQSSLVTYTFVIRLASLTGATYFKTLVLFSQKWS